MLLSLRQASPHRFARRANSLPRGPRAGGAGQRHESERTTKKRIQNGRGGDVRRRALRARPRRPTTIGAARSPDHDGVAVDGHGVAEAIVVLPTTLAVSLATWSYEVAAVRT